MRRLGSAVWLVAAWLVLTAATPMPVAPLPPDLTGLVPFVSTPLDKPLLELPTLTLPAPPLELPALPPATVVLPAGDKPIAPMPAPRTLPCVGTWTGSASEALECGRARFRSGDLDDAARILDQAVRNTSERDLVVEARYWLGETLVRLGRLNDADAQFRLAAQDRASAYAQYARHSGGWTSLVIGEPARAREAFAQVLGVSHPVAIDTWARHGMGLALYALGRFPEAQRTMADLLVRRPPPALERDAMFWNGDALGRTGEPVKAAAELSRFTQGGPHRLLAPGLVRLAWWSLVAKRPADSVVALRAYANARAAEPKPEGTATPPAQVGGTQDGADRDWVDATLALALLATDDWEGARTAAQALEARRSPLSVPVQLRLAAEALKRRAYPMIDTSVTELMRGTLTPPVRAWLLTVRGEAARAEGKGDDARTQYDLARGVEDGTETIRYATFRLAQTNLEMREFRQALADVGPLLAPGGDPGMRLATLLLQGEAAYRAGDYKLATTALERALAENPQPAEVRSVHLALAWTALRAVDTDEARRRFAEFAQLYPDDEQTPSALVLAAELALAAGDLQSGRELLERVISRYSRAPRTDFARLNRAILMLRSGEAPPAVPLLRDWISRAPFPPLLARAQVALAVALLASRQPAEAGREFAAARREGEGALASLGSATVAFMERRLPDAVRDFTEAQADGTPAIATTADYGLAVTRLLQGDVAAFRKAAPAIIDAAPRSPAVPPLLYALTAVSADARDWTVALPTAKRLVAEFPEHESADDALERVGAAAAKERAWPVVYEAYALLREKYPRSPFIDDSLLAFGEAQLETGRPAEAKKTLEQFVTGAPRDRGTARAAFAWVRACEATNDRACAVAAYARAADALPPAQWDKETVFKYTGLLTQQRQFDEARRLLEPLVKSPSPDVSAEGAFGIGETFRVQGDAASAVEYYMTAAYVAPDSLHGRQSLLAAGRLLAAQKQPDAAAVLYRKLLAQSDVPADIATAARRGLADIGR